MEKARKLVALVMILALLLPCCSTNASTQVDQVVLALQSEPETINPFNITGAYGDPIHDCIFEKFFDYSYEGEILNRLCTAYEVETNEQGQMIITFHLADNVTWHDGEKLTAQDVVFTDKLVTNPDMLSTRRYYWSSIVGTDDSGVCEDPDTLGVVALDDYTVQYTLKEVRALDAFFLIDMRFHYVMPEHLLKDIDPAQLHQSDFWLRPVGAGPLKFDSMVSGERYELVRNDDYYRGTTNFQRLVFVIMDPSNYAAALASGEIDATTSLSALPLDDWEYVQSLDNIETVSFVSYQYQWMNINHSREYLQDSRVRQAISFAINRQALVDQLLYGEGQYAVSSITPTSQYFNTKYAADPYNPEKAKQLLEEAGWDFDIVLDFAVPTGNKVRENSAVLIQQDLAAVGIKSQLRYVDFATEIVELREGNCDLGLLGGGSPDPDDVRINFNIYGSNNFSNLTDESFYEVLDEARSVMTPEERKVLYDQWQEMCYELTPIVWLYHANALFAYSDKFENYPCEDSLANNLMVLEWTFK